METPALAQPGPPLRLRLKARVAPFCRGVRTLVRPSLQRLTRAFQWLCDEPGPRPDPMHDLRTEIQQLCCRIDQLESQLQTTMAFGWDYIALCRRTAVLEDRVETLVQSNETTRAA